MNTGIEMETTLGLLEDDVILLEAFIHSPAYTAFKKLLANYRERAHSQLLISHTEIETFRVQGRLIAIQAIENLPTLVANQRQSKLRKREEEQKSRSPIQAPRA